jgi:hypothetical protein
MMRWLKSLLPAVATSRVALVPEGWCLVREKPTEAHIQSMCMRFDHSHGIKHSFPVEESDAHFDARRNFNRTMVLQLYEEAVGLGFHKIDAAEEQKEGSDMLEMFTDHDWMRADDYRTMADGIKFAGHSKIIERKPTEVEIDKLDQCTAVADSQGAVND